MSEAASSPGAAKKSSGCGCGAIVLVGLLLLLFGIVLGPVGSSIKQSRHNAAMQQGRQLGQAFFSYSTDNTANGNAYPDGKSSTEVFQKMIDGGYITDPAILYIPLPGKVKVVPGQKLKPENVCFDVTGGVDSSSSDLVPLIFMTGYKITYASGGSAVPIIKPYPPFWSKPRTWSEWWNGIPPPDKAPPGIAIFYKGNNATYQVIRTPDYTVPNVVSPDFKPDGHTYRQLTPDGVLP